MGPSPLLPQVGESLISLEHPYLETHLSGLFLAAKQVPMHRAGQTPARARLAARLLSARGVLSTARGSERKSIPPLLPSSFSPFIFLLILEISASMKLKESL